MLEFENDKIQVKVRYLVKGFEEKCSIQSNSPASSKKYLRIILAIASSKQWVLNSIDIKSSFLQ